MRLFPAIVLGAVWSLCPVPAESQGKSTTALPTLSDLKKLTFAPASDNAIRTEPDHAAIQDAIQSFQLFREGANEVQGWRWNEPPKTRGPRETAVYNAAVGAVVYIRAALELPVAGRYKSATGTGSILHPDDVVLTNWHVVRESYTGGFPIMVFLKPAKQVTPDDALALRADVVFYNDLKDLALLKFRSGPPYALPKLKIGSMSSLAVGQNIHIIGHPKGDTWSYGTGIISQIRPNYQSTFKDGAGRFEGNAIQMQAAINPGNSGGPVLDDSGVIIGVVSFGRSDAQNLEYAIAADEVLGFLQRYDKRDAQPKPAPTIRPKWSLSPLPGGGNVVKAEYPGAVAYMIVAPTGEVRGIVADTGDGDVVEATQAGSSGFSRWTARLANGKTVDAEVDKGKPVRFTTRRK